MTTKVTIENPYTNGFDCILSLGNMAAYKAANNLGVASGIPGSTATQTPNGITGTAMGSVQTPKETQPGENSTYQTIETLIPPGAKLELHVWPQKEVKIREVPHHE